jgi:hypothetical protein
MGWKWIPTEWVVLLFETLRIADESSGSPIALGSEWVARPGSVLSFSQTWLEARRGQLQRDKARAANAPILQTKLSILFETEKRHISCLGGDFCIQT